MLARITAEGWADELADQGVRIVTDTCTYITPILSGRPGAVMTDSAKWAWYAPGNLGYEVVFASLEECVESAVRGAVWRDSTRVAGRSMSQVLVAGGAEGDVLALDEPLSFWGGVDEASGCIIDVHHPQHGASVVGRVLVMPAGRGSSSSSSVLAELIRAGFGPAAILLGERDPIVALGAAVGRDALRPLRSPSWSSTPPAYQRAAAARRIRVLPSGEIEATAA